MTDANPVLVEVTRGGMVESRHRGAVAVVDALGKVIFSAGDVSAPVYARSSAKPLQALPRAQGNLRQITQRQRHCHRADARLGGQGTERGSGRLHIA